jgi:hypothetical protein
LLAHGGIGRLLSWALLKIERQALLPLWCAELVQERKGTLVDLINVLTAIDRP